MLDGYPSNVPSPPPPSPSRIDETLEQQIARYRADHRLLSGRVSELEKWKGRPPDPKNPDDEGEGIEGRLAMAEGFIGEPANPVRNRPATGFVLILEQLRTALDKLTSELAADRKAKDDAAEAQRSSPWARIKWIAIGAAVGTITSGGIGYAAIQLSKHWH